MIGGNFIWGQGGRRMTPEDISLERRIAASLSQPDYSPIQSPWQGLARVAGNVTGALRERNANRASEANAADSRSVIEALMNPSGGISEIGATQPPTMDDVSATVAGLSDDPTGAAAPLAAPASPGAPPPAPGGANPQQAIIAALANPYISEQARALAGQMYQQQVGQQQWLARKEWERAHPEPIQPTQTDRYVAEILDPNTDPRRRQLLQAVVTRPQEQYNPQTQTMDWVYPGMDGGTAPQELPITAPGWTAIPDEGGPTPAGSGGFP